MFIGSNDIKIPKCYNPFLTESDIDFGTRFENMEKKLNAMQMQQYVMLALLAFLLLKK